MPPPDLTLEGVLTARRLFGLVEATPVQRAVCRASDGLDLGELWEDRDVVESFGGTQPTPGDAPLEFCWLSGIRSGKSLLAAAKILQASQCCDVSRLRPGETPRVSCLSVDRDKATIVYNHLVGTVRAQPGLRGLLLGDPGSETLYLRHPTGVAVEVMVTAGRRAGASLVGRWMAGVIFDEAPRMQGEDDGVVNLDDCRRAVLGRMLPGAQILYIGSPWAPMGPVYEMWTDHFGHADATCVVVRSTGPATNPAYWTPRQIERVRRHDPIAYQTDVLAQFADPETALFTQSELDAVTREDGADLPVADPKEARLIHEYVAAMDPATRSNAWTFVVARCVELEAGYLPVLEVCAHRQWVPKGTPLSPRTVLTEIAEVCGRYGVDTVLTDQYAVDALTDVASQIGLQLHAEAATARTNYDSVATLRVFVQEKRIRLPRDPVMRQDLLTVKRRVTQDGVRFVLPKGAEGRHCDYVPSLAKVVAFPPGPPTAIAEQVDQHFERALEAVEAKKAGDWASAAAQRMREAV